MGHLKRIVSATGLSSDAAGLAPGDAQLRVLHGNPIVSIIEQEQECDCDLIVMGKHGQGLLEKLLSGSVTKQVLAGSQGDVLVSVAAGAPLSAGQRAGQP
ncbi:MAG: uspA [Massilia sp.]|jgi:nucleotide-binding universal stress UspA family protein|nr:uspA [Massilia sp.]MDB5792004.1 uspA [Massilia sp.]